MNSFFQDELMNCYTYLKETGVGAKLSGRTIKIFGDNHALSDYLNGVLSRISHKCEKADTFIYIADFERSDSDKSEDLLNVLNQLDDGCNFVLVSLFSFEKCFDGEYHSVAERELNALCRQDRSFVKANNVIKCENVLKSYIEKLNIKAIRFTNLFGPEIESAGDFKDIIAEFKYNNRVIIKKADYASYFSACYVKSALEAIFAVVVNGKSGNVYNASGMQLNKAEVKTSIYKSFCKSGTKLHFDDNDVNGGGYACLSCNKIESLGCNFSCELDDTLIRTVSVDEEAYINRYVDTVYDGKINILRKEEMKMLSEVDRICNKNNINYFLVGGSFLGAVRNGGFIPWDDDVDICMMREDYEKFRRICPKELSSEYAYQSYRDEKSTHYIFDKIRLKGTYFSSEHSNKFDDMENGVFVDIFVFDKTANSKLFQKLHVFLIVMLRRLIHVRWTKEPVTGKFALISKLILPLLCLLPFSLYHSLFERILRFYEHSKNSRFILDGTGLYIKKGAFPIEWMSRFKKISFESYEFNASEDSGKYLTMWYGENYMTPPEISKRTGHIISRFDLGDKLFDKQKNSTFSLNGELFDK